MIQHCIQSNRFYCSLISNQELVEKLKNDIWQQRNKEQEYLRAAEMTKNVLNSNRATLIDLILKLEESDENVTAAPAMGRDLSDTAEVLSGKTSNQALLQVNLLMSLFTSRIIHYIRSDP